jgi:hypothetical protein
MSDERKPPPRFRRPSELLDDEVVEIPPDGVSGRYPPPRPQEPFSKLVPTQAEQLREVLSTQRKMALQLDGFGQLINRRFDLFHEELALQRMSLEAVEGLVKGNHAPRLDKVETTLGQKAARGGGIAALILVAAPMLAEALPKYAAVFDGIAGLFR